MKRLLFLVFIITFIFSLTACGGDAIENDENDEAVNGIVDSQLTIPLPTPDVEGSVSVETALANRRSQRSFQDRAITKEQLSQILWSAYGITSQAGAQNPRGGLRTAPSAGALYPLEIYAIVGNVGGMEPGVYRYIPVSHELVMVVDGDVRGELQAAALNQRMVAEAPAAIFYSAIFEVTTQRYGERGTNYVYIEVGHSAQNVYLQAEALGLGTCAIGAFTEESIRSILNLPENEDPLYLMPIGYFN